MGASNRVMETGPPIGAPTPIPNHESISADSARRLD